MGWQLFQFGSLYLDGKPQRLPTGMKWETVVPTYDSRSKITLGDAHEGNSITWIKPDDFPLFISDSVLLTNISWDDLNKQGFVSSKEVVIDGRPYRCRLPQVGTTQDADCEWTQLIYATMDNNSLWNWRSMYTIGADTIDGSSLLCACRGYNYAKCFSAFTADRRNQYTGFRPVLEPAGNGAAAIGKTVFLDGQEFLLSQLQESDEDIFYPQLYPVESNPFRGIPDGSIVKMYTLLCDGVPVNQNPTKRGAFHQYNGKLALTDEFYGEDFLIPWTISHGNAIAAVAAFHEINSSELRRQGFL